MNKTIRAKTRRCALPHLSIQKNVSRKHIKVYHTYRIIYPILLPKINFFQMQGMKLHHKRRAHEDEHVRLRCKISKNCVFIGLNRDSPLIQVS
uniref:Uncharacterized protein n=1 Tax=Pleurostomum flabellatum TaxID=405751 RepID=A0A7T0M427_9EUKA|nr:hypothetical protein J6731_mgp10 [Pleurostomum flabellatum]QPL15631.1 hypothetical protein [Pleurostomum flabellatum]